jgi:signal transduction histidine kinase
VISAVREMSDEQQLLLANMPPPQRQVRLARTVVVVLLVAFVVTAPFSKTPLPRVDAFIPALETAILINDLITSALLFAQFVIVRQRALLVLASGYLFTALIVIPHALTFPGLFAPTGLLGAGLQSTVWLYIFWHAGSPLAVIVYVLLKEADSGTTKMSRLQPTTAIGWSVTLVLVLVCVMTWVATAGNSLLPRVFFDSIHINRTPSLITSAVIMLLEAAALVLLWLRRRSVLDLWLMVVCCTWLLEVWITAFLIGSRFDLGWYAGRVYGLIATLFVLLVLLFEATASYARLAQSVIRQQSDREGRQVAMDAMAASIAHEVKQPLTAIVANADAGVHLLTMESPNLDEARAALDDIADAGRRAFEVIDSVRAMFKKGVHGRGRFSVNDLVREVLAMVDVDLRLAGILVSTELREGLPQLLVDRGQLQQVFLNLVMNAIEATRSVADRERSLRITSDIILDTSGVLVTVEDSGMGVAEENRNRIFETFFSTKSTGTGLGLTICRSIIESHGGSIQVLANKPHGTIFHVALPPMA